MEQENRHAARLMLEDGSVYEGMSFGVPGTIFGELVFNTSATGYQEVLTDPSYRGQIVMMTSTEVGNYGVNREDYESEQIHAKGFVIKRLSHVPSSWRSQISLDEFLIRNNIVGIEGVDTRSITRRIRKTGAMRAGITTENIPAETFLEQVKSQPGLEAQDLVAQVTPKRPYTRKGHSVLDAKLALNRLVVVDFGIKKSILDYLQQYVHEIIVLPASSSFGTVMSYQPEGVLLSNGPGDPSVLHDAIAMARQLVESKVPTFGICLGHQILALACHARVSKMRFGHHGGNHPVKDVEQDQITITSQNHGYALEFEAFPEDTLKVTHLNLNDGSIEGFRHLNAPVWSVQFHPEASPGPHDSNYLFSRFIRQVLDVKSGAVSAP